MSLDRQHPARLAAITELMALIYANSNPSFGTMVDTVLDAAIPLLPREVKPTLLEWRDIEGRPTLTRIEER